MNTPLLQQMKKRLLESILRSHNALEDMFRVCTQTYHFHHQSQVLEQNQSHPSQTRRDQRPRSSPLTYCQTGRMCCVHVPCECLRGVESSVFHSGSMVCTHRLWRNKLPRNQQQDLQSLLVSW